MLANPKVGQRVQVHYSPKKALWMAPIQDKIGVVIVAGKGKPRNHLVEIDGVKYVVPCGNISKA